MNQFSIKLHQSVQLRQELRINPRLYQAMELLYMPIILELLGIHDPDPRGADRRIKPGFSTLAASRNVGNEVLCRCSHAL